MAVEQSSRLLQLKMIPSRLSATLLLCAASFALWNCTPGTAAAMFATPPPTVILAKKLSRAAREGNYALVKELLEQGAKDTKYKSALQDAVLIGHLPMVRLLLKNGFSIHPRLLHYVVILERYEIAKLLIENGAELDKKSGYHGNPGGALHHAAARGDIRMMKLLMDGGASLNIQDKYKATPLHYAAWTGRSQAVELLLEQGADIVALDERQATPLHYAAWRGHISVLKLLLARGALPHLTDQDGLQPLDMAKINNRWAAIELLRALR